MTLKNILVALLIGLISQNILASGMYTDLSTGQSTFPSVDASSFDSSIDEDRNSISFSLIGGYSTSKYLSVEVAYNSLGEYSLSVTPFAGGPSSSLEYDITSFSLSIIPKYPVSDKWSIYAKLGNHWWNAKGTNKYVSYNNGTFSGFNLSEIKESDNDILIGLGVSYAVTKTVMGKFSITQYRVDDEDVDNYSFAIGLSY